MSNKMIALLIALVVGLGVGTIKAVDEAKDHSQDVMTDVEDSIYRLSTQMWTGTGWAVKAKSGKVVVFTNVHVCDSPSNLMTTVKDGITHVLKVLYKDSKHDICVLEAPPNAKPLKLANKLNKEELVYSIGFPIIEFMTSQSGRAKGYTSVHMRMPIPIEKCVGAEKYSIKDIPIEQEDGSIKPEKICIFTAIGLVTTIQVDGGGSGSPILNGDEEVVGMTMLRVGQIGWAQGVPLYHLKRVLNKF